MISLALKPIRISAPTHQTIKKQNKALKARAFNDENVFIPPNTDPILESMNNKLRQAIADAMDCHNQQFDSVECANLWGDVEDLTRAVYDYTDKHPARDALESWCDDTPGAPECRSFDL